MSDEYNDDYRHGYNDAVRFYDKHDAERQQQVETLTRQLNRERRVLASTLEELAALQQSHDRLLEFAQEISDYLYDKQNLRQTSRQWHAQSSNKLRK